MSGFINLQNSILINIADQRKKWTIDVCARILPLLLKFVSYLFCSSIGLCKYALCGVINDVVYLLLMSIVCCTYTILSVFVYFSPLCCFSGWCNFGSAFGDVGQTCIHRSVYSQWVTSARLNSYDTMVAWTLRIRNKWAFSHHNPTDRSAKRFGCGESVGFPAMYPLSSGYIALKANISYGLLF